MFALLLLPVAGESLAQTATTTIELELSTDSVQEYTATVITVTAKYPEGSTVPAGPNTVAITVADGTATGGIIGANDNVDYGTVVDFDIIILAGASSMTGTFTLTAAVNSADESPGETVVVSGASGSFTIEDVRFTIEEDPLFPTTIDLSLSTNYVPENSTTVITVTAALPEGSTALTTTTDVEVSVVATTATDGTDFTTITGIPLTITIPVGATSMSMTGTFTLTTADDAVPESGGETLTVSGVSTGFTIADVTLTIIDDDSDPTTILIGLDTESVTEGTTTAITVTAAFPDGSRALASALEVMFTVANGSAMASVTGTEGDFEVSAATFTVTIPASSTEDDGTGSFNLTVNDDTELEGTENIQVQSTGVIGYQITPTTEVVRGTGLFLLEIEDADTQADTITLSLDRASVTEGVDTMTEITVTASIPDDTATGENLPVTVALLTTGTATEGATEDFTVGTLPVITITAGMLTGSETFTLTVVDDTDTEVDETVVFSGTLDPAVTGFNAIANEMLTIRDDDGDDGTVQAETITLSLDPASVIEGSVGTGTTTEVTVTASIPDGTATGEDLPVTVALLTTGTATEGATEDFTVGTLPVITITAGNLTGSGTFMLTVVDDEDMEEDETLVFSGTLGTTTAVYNAIENATLTIVDDEAPQADTITLSLDPTRVAEGMGTTTNTATDGVVTTTTQITVAASIPDGTGTGEDLPVTVALATGTGAGSATLSLTTDDDPGDGSVSTTSTLITIMPGMRTATGTFMLTVVDDEDTEGDETLVFSGTLGTTVASFNAIANVTLTIVDNDGAPSIDAVLPELTRVSVASVIDVLSGRIEQVASGASGGGSASFAGHSSLAQALAANQQGLNDGDLSLLEALAGSSIALELDGTGTAAPSAGGQAGSSGGIGVWASADYDRISSKDDGLGDWDGSQFSLSVGVDGHVSRSTLIGVAASWSKGSAEFDSDPTLDTDTSLLGLNPYIGWHSRDGKKTAWGTVGYSSGDFEQDQQNNLETDLKMTVLAVGGSTRLAKRAGLDFDIKGDLSTAELTTDAIGTLPEVKSKAHRARVAVEAGVAEASDSGEHVIWSGALGLRYDGGDGDTGSGLELDGELGWSDRSVSVSGAANVLLFHTGDLKEWGLAGLIRYTPSHSKGRNLTFRAQPSYGRGENGSGQLWDQQVKDLDEDGGEPEARLVMDAGWGLAALSGRGLLTPYSGLELSESGSRVYRLGSRVAIDSVFNIDLAAHRTEDGDSPEHGIGLQLGMQW